MARLRVRIEEGEGPREVDGATDGDGGPPRVHARPSARPGPADADDIPDAVRRVAPDVVLRRDAGVVPRPYVEAAVEVARLPLDVSILRTPNRGNFFYDQGYQVFKSLRLWYIPLRNNNHRTVFPCTKVVRPYVKSHRPGLLSRMPFH